MIKRSRKSKALKKRLIPVILAVALVLASSISIGFSMWSDELSVEGTVNFAPKPLNITNIEPYAVTGFDTSSADSIALVKSGIQNQTLLWAAGRLETSFTSSSRYAIAYHAFGVKDFAYNAATRTATAATSFTKNNAIGDVLPTLPSVSGNTYTSGAYTYYSTNPSGGIPIWAHFADSERYMGKYNRDTGVRIYEFFGGNIPFKVTVSNPNPIDVDISLSYDNTKLTVTSPPTKVAANSTVTFTCDPVRVNGSFANSSYSVSFTDGDGREYTASLKIA